MMDDYYYPALPLAAVRPPLPPRGDQRIHIEGDVNLLTHIAGCCKPVPGDAVVGYITQGRGVSVHRDDCSKLLPLQQAEPERVVAVSWGDGRSGRAYPGGVLTEAYDLHAVVRGITS